MTFTQPWILAAAPVMVVLVVVGLARLAARRRRLADFLGGRRAAARLGRSSLYRLPAGRMILLGLAALLLAAAAAGPGWSDPADTSADDPPEPPPPGVLLAIDISASMQADDADPTRLARAAEVARELLDTLDHARVGLVLFSGTPYTLAPPTRDHAVLEYLLDGITADLVNIYDPGSLPSAVLRESAPTLTPSPGPDDDSLPTAARNPRDDSAGAAAGSGIVATSDGGPGRRTLVLIGDGEAGEPAASVRDEARAAADAGIRIHTVGVGTAEGGRMILPAGYTRKGTDGTGPRGPMATRLEASTLREVAEIGDGLYAHADDPAALDRIRRVLSDPAPEPPPEPDVPLWARFDPGAVFVALALLALLTEGLLARPVGRSRGARPWTGAGARAAGGPS